VVRLHFNRLDSLARTARCALSDLDSGTHSDFDALAHSLPTNAARGTEHDLSLVSAFVLTTPILAGHGHLSSIRDQTVILDAGQRERITGEDQPTRGPAVDHRAGSAVDRDQPSLTQSLDRGGRDALDAGRSAVEHVNPLAVDHVESLTLRVTNTGSHGVNSLWV